MKKYWIVIKNQWAEMTTYRLSFTIWRIRTVVQFLSIYFLWFVLIPKNHIVSGYSQSLILTYIFGTAFVDSLVFSSRTFEVADQINRGDLSNFLIRPINYFLYWFSRDIGDKAMNMFFFLIEIVLLIIILRPPLFLQTNILFISLSIICLSLAVILYFFINLSLGFISFWSSETWAPRFIFITSVYFISGGLFPLDILPKSIVIVMKGLPFMYLIYFPIKVYLGQFSLQEIFTGILVSIFWISILFEIAKLIWAKGLRTYTAQGR